MSDVAGLYRRFGVKLPALTDGWATTRCFTGSHKDRHPSARVHLRTGGFRCFACGARGGVLDALQLLGVWDRDEARRLAVDHRILDPPKRPRAAVTAATPAAVTAEPVNYDNVLAGPVIAFDRTWTYVDERGEPIGRVRRLDLTDGQKRIWQERPDGDQWLAGLNGTHLPLYQLPLVISAAEHAMRVLSVEGEKAVDALDRLGLLATTNAGGAGKWRPEHTAALRGATVLAIADCDLAGRLHAIEVSQKLYDAGVRVLTPFDPAPLRNDGYDIVDYLTEVADTARAVHPDRSEQDIRDALRDHLRRQLGGAPLTNPDELNRLTERARHTADPDGKRLVTCDSCGRERPHRISHELVFCPCGAHQTASI